MSSNGKIVIHKKHFKEDNQGFKNYNSQQYGAILDAQTQIALLASGGGNGETR